LRKKSPAKKRESNAGGVKVSDESERVSSDEITEACNEEEERKRNNAGVPLLT